MKNHIKSEHQKFELVCSLCGKKFERKVFKELMSNVHEKIPVKIVNYTVGPKGKTETKTSYTWNNIDPTLEDSTKKGYWYDESQ